MGAKKIEIESSNRAYLILSCIASAQDPRELNVSEISRQTKIPITTTQNLCQKLHNEDYLSIIESPISKHYTIDYSKLVEMFFDFFLNKLNFAKEYLYNCEAGLYDRTFEEIKSNKDLNLVIYAHIKLTLRQAFIEFQRTNKNSASLNVLFTILINRRIYQRVSNSIKFKNNDFGEFDNMLNLLIDQNFIEDIIDVCRKSKGKMI
jgi:hypothetical protein